MFIDEEVMVEIRNVVFFEWLYVKVVEVSFDKFEMYMIEFLVFIKMFFLKSFGKDIIYIEIVLFIKSFCIFFLRLGRN